MTPIQLIQQMGDTLNPALAEMAAGLALLPVVGLAVATIFRTIKGRL